MIARHSTRARGSGDCWTSSKSTSRPSYCDKRTLKGSGGLLSERTGTSYCPATWPSTRTSILLAGDCGGRLTASVSRYRVALMRVRKLRNQRLLSRGQQPVAGVGLVALVPEVDQPGPFAPAGGHRPQLPGGDPLRAAAEQLVAQLIRVQLDQRLGQSNVSRMSSGSTVRGWLVLKESTWRISFRAAAGRRQRQRAGVQHVGRAGHQARVEKRILPGRRAQPHAGLDGAAIAGRLVQAQPAGEPTGGGGQGELDFLKGMDAQSPGEIQAAAANGPPSALRSSCIGQTPPRSDSCRLPLGPIRDSGTSRGR